MTSLKMYKCNYLIWVSQHVHLPFEYVWPFALYEQAKILQLQYSSMRIVS